MFTSRLKRAAYFFLLARICIASHLCLLIIAIYVNRLSIFVPLYLLNIKITHVYVPVSAACYIADTSCNMLTGTEQKPRESDS